jgi:hypothetical protein
MKKLKITFGAMILASVILTSCGGDSANTNKEAEIEKGRQESTNTSNDSIAVVAAQMKSHDSIKVTDFVKTFYSALELSPSLNQKQYEEGGVQFNLNQFKSCVDNKSIFSKLRISNLTGDYHARYNIILLGIDSITENGNNKVAYTTVKYEIYELGTFQNLEKIIINSNQNRLILNKWEDIKLKKMSVAEYEGLENYHEKDFYKTIGSINK